MDKQLKADWIEALRSGKYTQGKRVLRRSDGQMCCLGVLREIQAPESKYENEQTTFLHLEHRAGLTESEMDFVGNILNDARGSSFAEIADYIEANL